MPMCLLTKIEAQEGVCGGGGKMQVETRQIVDLGTP